MSKSYIYLQDNLFITFSIKIYIQIVDIPIGTNCNRIGVDIFSLLRESLHVTKIKLILFKLPKLFLNT